MTDHCFDSLFFGIFCLFFGFSDMPEGAHLLPVFSKKCSLWSCDTANLPLEGGVQLTPVLHRGIAGFLSQIGLKKDTHNSDFVDNLE